MNIFFKLAHNGWQICDVADLVEVFFILPKMFIRSRMYFLLPNPPYSQICCYGLVYINIINTAAAAPEASPPSVVAIKLE